MSYTFGMFRSCIIMKYHISSDTSKNKNMGAFLATPNTEKISIDEDHEKVSFGVSGMQGWRMSMEVSDLSTNKCSSSD